MLVAARDALDGMDVDAALVRESRLAHPRLTGVVAQVGDLVHELGQLLELRQRLRRHADLAELELERGHDAGEVAVPGALAVAVDGALDVGRAGLQGGDGVGDAKAAVVVGVDPDPGVQLAVGEGGDPRDLARHRAAVGLAEADDVRAGLLRGLPGGEGVFGLVLEPVEAVLGVVDHDLALVLQVADRVGDHREVLVRFHPEDLGDVEQPGLADHADDRGRRVEQHPYLLVLLDRHALFARETEAGDLGVLPLAAFRLLEELHVLRVRARPSAFDVVDPEGVQPLGDAQLVGQGEIDAFALRTVAERRVVDLNFVFHSEAVGDGRAGWRWVESKNPVPTGGTGFSEDGKLVQRPGWPMMMIDAMTLGICSAAPREQRPVNSGYVGISIT